MVVVFISSEPARSAAGYEEVGEAEAVAGKPVAVAAGVEGGVARGGYISSSSPFPSLLHLV